MFLDELNNPSVLVEHEGPTSTLTIISRYIKQPHSNLHTIGVVQEIEEQNSNDSMKEFRIGKVEEVCRKCRSGPGCLHET